MDGMKAMQAYGTPPPRTVIGDPLQVVLTGPKPSGVVERDLPSVGGTEEDALRHDAVADEVPERDEQLACQGDDHLLAQAGRLLGACFKPLGQGALLLEVE